MSEREGYEVLRRLGGSERCMRGSVVMGVMMG